MADFAGGRLACGLVVGGDSKDTHVGGRWQVGSLKIEAPKEREREGGAVVGHLIPNFRKRFFSFLFSLFLSFVAASSSSSS